MALTETWLAGHTDAELSIEGYTLFRQNRKPRGNRRGRDSGGVAVYMRKDIAADMETILGNSNGVIEITGLHSKAKNLLLIVLYRQPDDIKGGHRSTSTEFKQALSKLGECLSSFSQMPDTLLCGDFNLPNAKWSNSQENQCAVGDERKMIDDLIELGNEFFLTQFIKHSTHMLGNTLDLIFSNNPAMLHSSNGTETVLSHHFLVECMSYYQATLPNDEKPVNGDSTNGFGKLNFFSEDIDWTGLERELRDHNWNLEFRACNPEKMFKKFVEICIDISTKYVPLRKTRVTSQTKSFIPRDRKNLMRRKRRITAQLKKTTSEARRKKLKGESVQVERALIKSYQQSQKDRETKAVNAIKRNSKYFFSYAKKFSTTKAGIGPFFDYAKKLITSPIKMAVMLSEQYSSVYSVPKQTLPEAKEIFTFSNERRQTLKNIIFDEQDIIEAIDQISPSAAAGPDGFPALLLKMCRHSLAKPLFLIWRKSLDTGEVPFPLKTANVVPIHKGGSCGTPANYRPVALTSHLIKIFERVLRKYIVAWMDENNLFNPTQHGFRQGRSCLSQLIAHFDHITQLLESGENVDVIYLDFAKAFDKIDFLSTMRKLNHMGISGKLGHWLYSFLTNRKQAVLVNGTIGSFFDVKSGVPQGSVIGPLLFLVLISDIDQEIVSAFLSSFADDTRIAKGITSEDDVKALQSDLQSIYKWAQENNMEFNSPKFECLRYGANSVIKESTCYTSSTGDTIEVSDQVKDLGVIMSCTGTFRQHIDSVISTSNQLCGWVLRTFKTRQELPMLTLWKSLIRSKLEYCCPLWSPINIGDIQGLEQIQRNYFRKISGIQHLSYWEQLKKLSMYSLERRRERYNIIYVWKIMEKKVPNFSQSDNSGIQEYWNLRRGGYCTVPAINLRSQRQIQSIRDASFGIRGPRLFNTLPAHIRNLSGCSVDAFKHKLDRYLSTVPDEPQIRGYTAMRRAESNSLLHMAQSATSQEQPIGRASQ